MTLGDEDLRLLDDELLELGGGSFVDEVDDAIELAAAGRQFDGRIGHGHRRIAGVHHTKPELERVSIRDVHFDPADHLSFQVVDPDGRRISIPLHRIRKVYRDGALIWSRPETE